MSSRNKKQQPRKIGNYYVVENNADGNCLFESIAMALCEAGAAAVGAAEIREMVGNFYREFDKDINYPENTIEYKIKLGINYDNEDEEMQHDYNIWNDFVWASMTDVLICSVLFDVNIDLYDVNGAINEIRSQYDFGGEPLKILYNEVNHFEALSTAAPAAKNKNFL
jgi:hypothetical protein